MSAFTTESPSEEKRNSLICPFLGFEDDPSTALAYPANYNFCYKCKPIASVSLAHQRNRCLTAEYSECVVFQTKASLPLPKELRGEKSSKGKSKSWLPIAALALVLILALIGGILIGIIPIPGFSPPYMVVYDTEEPGASPIRSETPLVATPTLSSTKTPKQTETPKPTATQRLSRTPLGLGTPFGDSPELVIHKVLEGEGYLLIAENFHTSVEAIKAINYQAPEALWLGSILVVPKNTDDVSHLPQFKTYQVNVEGLTIEMLAERLNVEVDLMKEYNHLPAGTNLKLGEWLVIPMHQD